MARGVEIETMQDVVICEPVRTPIGAYGGSLRDVSAAELAAQAITGVVEHLTRGDTTAQDRGIGAFAGEA